VGRADCMGLAVSIVATAKEKVTPPQRLVLGAGFFQAGDPRGKGVASDPLARIFFRLGKVQQEEEEEEGEIYPPFLLRFGHSIFDHGFLSSKSFSALHADSENISMIGVGTFCCQ